MIVLGGEYTCGPLEDLWSLSLTDDPVWAQILPSGEGPGARTSLSAVYDSNRGRVLTFGGSRGSQSFNDVHALTLRPAPAWSRLETTGPPPSARSGTMAIYDPVRDRMIVFGGRTSATSAWVTDVWELTLGGTPTWSQLLPDGVYPPAADGRAVYDPAGDRIVVFLAPAGGNTLLAWQLTLSGTPTWSPLSPSGTPPAVYPPFLWFSAVLDPARNRVVITSRWALTLGAEPAWVPLSIPPGPFPERTGQTAIYDPLHDRVVLFGDGTYEWDSHTWTLDLAAPPVWTEHVFRGTPPSTRRGAKAIHDPLRHRMILFGGFALLCTNETWTLALSGPPLWTELTPAGPPPPVRAYHAAIYDPLRDRMIVFAGGDWAGYPPYGPYETPLDDLWSLSLGDAPAWQQMVAAGTPPPPGSGYAATYDPTGDRMLVSNGAAAWALELAGEPTWTTLPVTGVIPPSPRQGPAIIGDLRHNRLVMYGGRGLSDTWSLTLGSPPAWEGLPAGTAYFRSWCTAIQDPIGERMVLHGGRHYGDDCIGFLGGGGYCYDYQGDTWALGLSGTSPWTQLSPTGIECRLPDPAGIYDPEQDRMIVTTGKATRALTWGRLPVVHPIRVDVDPDVINLRSRGRWLTVSIQPSDFDPASIDTASVRLEESIAPEPGFAVIGDQDFDGVPDLYLRFRRDLVIARLQPGAAVLRIDGSLTNGDRFQGSDTVRVIVGSRPRGGPLRQTTTSLEP